MNTERSEAISNICKKKRLLRCFAPRNDVVRWLLSGNGGDVYRFVHYNGVLILFFILSSCIAFPVIASGAKQSFIYADQPFLVDDEKSP